MGINRPEGYDVRFAEIVSQLINLAFHTAPNKFQPRAKMNWSSSTVMLKAPRPRPHENRRLTTSAGCLPGFSRGIGESFIPTGTNRQLPSCPATHANPTQCEATMAGRPCHVGNDAWGPPGGNFELNVFAPSLRTIHPVHPPLSATSWIPSANTALAG